MGTVAMQTICSRRWVVERSSLHAQQETHKVESEKKRRIWAQITTTVINKSKTKCIYGEFVGYFALQYTNYDFM